MTSPKRILLREALNGGWIMEANGDFGIMPDILGAYTTPKDLLDALDTMLCGEPPEVTRIKAEQSDGAA